jgi:hypothetical protein
MESGNATDGVGRTDETDQGGPRRESSPTPPDKTARSDMDSNLPFGLGKGYVQLTKFARPDQQSPTEATKVARPEQQSPTEAVKSQDTFALATNGPEQLTPTTVVMSPEDQAQVARWREQASKGRVVPPGHESTMEQRLGALGQTLALKMLAESSARHDMGKPTAHATAPVPHNTKAAMPA